MSPLTLPSQPAAELPKLASERFSAVVLPFVNLSGDPTQDYLADVCHRGIDYRPLTLPKSLIIARSTAFTYKGKPVEVKRLGSELGVRYVLEGSTQGSGDRVRVTAQLIDAQTGTYLWADQFDKAGADLLAMQDEIVVRGSRAVQIEFVAADAARTTRKPDNVDAQDLALRCEAATIINPDKRGPAFALCEQALRLDDRNVLALSLLANKILASVDAGLSVDPDGDVRKAYEMTLQALAAAPNDS